MLQERLPYRVCVGMMLLNREGLVFVGRRRNKRQREHVAPGYEWQMPQGGIDPGEEPYQAALRELHEETGVSSVSLIAEAPDEAGARELVRRSREPLDALGSPATRG